MAQDCKRVDLEVGLVGAEPVEELRKTDSSRPSRGWRIYLALLAIGLCAAAAIFFAVHDLKKQESTAEPSGDLRHALRQISAHRTTKIETAIHLEGVYDPQNPKKGVEWTDEADQGFQKGNIKLEDNEIVIPSTGLYFVYSQVSFNIKCHVSQGEPLETVHLEHIVNRRSTTFDNYRPLLHAKRSGCERVVVEDKDEDDGKRWYTTINLGAVFSLHKGDRLFTKTEPLNQMTQLDAESGQTFFGAFAL